MFMFHLLRIRLITNISTAQKRMMSAVVAPSESTFHEAAEENIDT